jgi:DUF4097 and DUF4098 domain-containing protein YvlB
MVIMKGFGKMYQVSRENPWDGDLGDRDSTRACAIPAMEIARRLATPILLVFSLFFLTSLSHGQGVSQSKDQTQTQTQTQNKQSATTNDLTVELVEDYAYLIEQLAYLTTDYCRYFGEMQGEIAEENQKDLTKLCKRLISRDRYEDIDGLALDLRALIDGVKIRETRLAEVLAKLEDARQTKRADKAKKKLLVLTRNLRQELEDLDWRLEEEVVGRLEKRRKDSETVHIFMESAFVDSITKSVQLQIEREGLSSLVILGDSIAKVTPIIVHVEPPVPPAAPKVTVAVSVPVDQYHTTRGDYDQSHSKKGHAAASRSFIKNLTVKADQTPIYIINPAGNIDVVGWNGSTIEARLDISIMAPTSGQAQEAVDNVELRIYRHDGKVYVESSVPHFKDPSFRVIAGAMEIKTPNEHPLHAQVEYGLLTAKNFSGDVNIVARNSHVELSDITGSIAAVNHSGRIDVSGITGSLHIKNRNGPINVDLCEGSFELQNMFGDITLTDCSGNAAVLSENGAVTVADLDGNLTVQNAYAPMTIRDINGSAELENNASLISVMDVVGKLKAVNRNGLIDAAGIHGQLNLQNDGGKVSLLIYDALGGDSRIASTNGSVALGISPLANLMLSAEAVYGALDFDGIDPESYEISGSVKSAKLSLGSPAHRLAVVGNNATIVVAPLD